MGPDEALLTVSRRREWFGGAIAFKVFLDGQQTGRVLSGSRVDIALLPGRHELQVRSRRHETDVIEFDAPAGERLNFQTQNAHSSKTFASWFPQGIELWKLEQGVVPELRNTWSRRAALLQLFAWIFVLLGIANAFVEKSVSQSYLCLAIAAIVLVTGVVLRTGRFDNAPA